MSPHPSQYGLVAACVLNIAFAGCSDDAPRKPSAAEQCVEGCDGDQGDADKPNGADARIPPQDGGRDAASATPIDAARDAASVAVPDATDGAAEDDAAAEDASEQLPPGPIVDGGAQTIGTGDVTKPARGPAPTEKVGGADFVLVKNWDFGEGGTIKDTTTLVDEFQFHDMFGTIANGTNYGAVTVAANAATAINAPDLGLPNNKQPIEDPAHPTRTFTSDSMLAYVRPLNANATTCSASRHDAGNGSITSKWKLDRGGSLLGKDLLWETRVRMPKTAPAYWFSLWTAGTKWNKGAEMDVVESFGTSDIYPPPTAFHVNSVGGRDDIDYSSWPKGLQTAGVPANGRDLTEYHVYTWVYTKDDKYKVYYDGHVVQSGSIHWTLGGATGAEPLDMYFLFDFGWGQTQIAKVNLSLPASSFPIEYEIDYSRVYLR
jgi:hypothetical protein